MPWRPNRKTRPFCDSGGNFSATCPVTVGTTASAPRIASYSGTVYLRREIVALALEARMRLHGDDKDHLLSAGRYAHT